MQCSGLPDKAIFYHFYEGYILVKQYIIIDNLFTIINMEIKNEKNYNETIKNMPYV